MAQIICENVSVGYEGHKVAEHIEFEVHQGDYLCIVGENGSGKSTLMKTLLSLQNPIEGKITFSDGVSAKEIGYLPQQTDVQRDFPASVWEVVISGCQNKAGLRPFYTREEKNRARHAIAEMSLDALKERCYRELSGGQQQRVLLARALCATEKILLLDEPVAGLDPKVAAEMYETIAELNRQGTTIIMISHNLTDALPYATHVLHVGDPMFFGTKETYLESKTFKQFFDESKNVGKMLGGAEQ